MSTQNLFLPFTVVDSNRNVPFSENIEVAALLCVAESERKKKPGIFGRSAEDLTILCRLNYPLWAIPFEGASLLIDGMETVSNSILYFKPPDIEAFTEHLRRSTGVQELFCGALRSHLETFSKFASRTEMPIRGVIANKEYLSDIFDFIQDGKTLTKRSAESELNSLIPPKIDKVTAVDIAERFMKHLRKLQAEIKGLRFAIETVDGETEKHINRLRQERKVIQEEYEIKISKLKTEVNQRKAELERELSRKVEKVTAVHKKEVETRLVEKKKRERELLKLEQKKSEYEKRKDLRKTKGDKVGIVRWNVRLQNAQDQIATAKTKIKTLSDFIDRSNKEMDNTKKNLHNTYQKHLDAEERRIKDLNSKKEADIANKEKEINELQGETTIIINKIERLIKRKQDRSSTIRETTIPWKAKAPTLIHLPLYLVCYKSKNKERYCLHLPALIRGDKGFAMKIRKTLRRRSLQSKISSLLKPRSKALEKLLKPFKEEAHSDSKVRKVLSRLGKSQNLLKTEKFKELVTAGMKKLEAEGWIKPEEKTAILETYAPKGPSR